MHIKDLEIFNEMWFLFRVKDAQGRQLFGNKVICDLDGKKCSFGISFIIDE